MFVLQFPLGWPSFQDIRNGNSRVTVSEMGIIPATGNSNPESVARNSGNSNMMNLPSSVSVLKDFHKQVQDCKITTNFHLRFIVVLAYSYLLHVTDNEFYIISQIFCRSRLKNLFFLNKISIDPSSSRRR